MNALLETVVTIALFAVAVWIAAIIEQHSCNPKPKSTPKRPDFHNHDHE